MRRLMRCPPALCVQYVVPGASLGPHHPCAVRDADGGQTGRRGKGHSNVSVSASGVWRVGEARCAVTWHAAS